jgi:hypothetical protein
MVEENKVLPALKRVKRLQSFSLLTAYRLLPAGASVGAQPGKIVYRLFALSSDN